MAPWPHFDEARASARCLPILNDGAFRHSPLLSLGVQVHVTSCPRSKTNSEVNTSRTCDLNPYPPFLVGDYCGMPRGSFIHLLKPTPKASVRFRGSSPFRRLPFLGRTLAAPSPGSNLIDTVAMMDKAVGIQALVGRDWKR